jgi:hypothetical protein
MTDDKEKLKKEGLEQLAEKQAEEMDEMLAKRFDLPQSNHSGDHNADSEFSDLFSGIPKETNRG